MCKVQMIRKEPGLLAIPVEKAVYCGHCAQISNSAWRRCGLCGSGEMLRLIRLLGASPDPEPTPSAAYAGGVLLAA